MGNGERDMAFQHYEKALTIGLKTLPSNDIRLSMLYTQTGEMYRTMGNREKAVEYFEKAAIIANPTSLGSRRRLQDRIYYVCRRCHQSVWAYAVFGRIKETCPNLLYFPFEVIILDCSSMLTKSYVYL